MSAVLENNTQTKEPPLAILLLFMCFASICAVLYTPALPQIAQHFNVGVGATQLTVTIYLLGYTFGQLIYGPFANRFGRRNTIMLGIGIEVLSSLLCGLTTLGLPFWVLVLGRLLMALGAAVGLTMSFGIVAESYSPTRAVKIMAYLALAFAIMPSLGSCIGGFIVEHLNWASCFYFLALYGIVLAYLCLRLPESQRPRDLKALYLKNLFLGYKNEWNKHVLIYALMGGCNTAMIYVFATAAPFVGIQILGASPDHFGTFTLIPAIGFICGTLLASRLAHRVARESLISYGIIIMAVGVIPAVIIWLCHALTLWTLFLPMIIVFCGGTIIFSVVPSLAVAASLHKSNASGLFSFLNMATGTFAVLLLSILHFNILLEVPLIFIAIMAALWVLNRNKPIAVI